MSETKKKSPMMAIGAVVLLLAAGGIAYFSKDKDGTSDATAEVTANAGAVSGDITQIQQSTDGINVEPGNPVVAKVDGKEITRTDVYRFIQTMPANVQQMPAVQVYPVALEEVINTRIVQTQAEKAKIEETDMFKEEMKIAKQQISRNLYLQKQVDAKITDKMVKKSYNEYLKKVPEVEERRARHILVETEGKAKAAIEKLNTGGKFEELAAELSIGPTAPKGGDLGYFAQQDMVPEFANAAFGMKKGTILEAPVQTKFGWHVIKLEDIRNREKPTLEQMTPALRADLSRATLAELLQDWRKGAKVEQFDINGKPLKDGANAIGIVPQEAPAPANDNKEG